MTTGRRRSRVLPTLVLWGLGACGVSTPVGPGSSDSETRLAARPGVPTMDPVIGESSLGLGPLGSDGLLYVPKAYSTDQPMPLIIGLHGSAGRAIHWRSWYQIAEDRAFVFLAIDARGSTWDRTRVGYFGPDVTFLDQALEHVFDRVAIDPSQIALIGYSDGASWALSLGVNNGDLFSSILAFAPGYFDPAGPLFGRPGIWIAHGTSDTTVPASRTRNQIVPAVRGLGLDVVYHEFAGGHQIPGAVATAGLDWLNGR